MEVLRAVRGAQDPEGLSVSDGPRGVRLVGTDEDDLDPLLDGNNIEAVRREF